VIVVFVVHVMSA